jgi:hypothetical protein
LLSLYTTILLISAGTFGGAIIVCLLFGYNIYRYSNGRTYSAPKYTDTKIEKYKNRVNRVNKWKLKPCRGNTMMRWTSMNSENVNIWNYVVAIPIIPIIVGIAIPLAIYYMVIDL